jgi:hypothetical protein
LVVCDELAKKGFKGVMGVVRINIGGAGDEKTKLSYFAGGGVNLSNSLCSRTT